MRTLLRDGLDRYEVLRGDEPLRRGERLVDLSDPKGAVEFLNRLGGPGGRDLLRLARGDFADEFTGVPDARIAAELARRISGGKLKLVQVVVAPPRLRANGAEYIVLQRNDEPRRGESMLRVWGQTAALSMGRLLAALPPNARDDVARISGSPHPASSLEQSRNFSRLLVTGHIRVARVSALRKPAGGQTPPPADLQTPALIHWSQLTTALETDAQGAYSAKPPPENEKTSVANTQKTPAPETLTLPEELVNGLNAAWKDSFPDGKSQEQGGILVRGLFGKYHWKRGKPGTQGTFLLNLEDKGFTEKLIATAHTHPYDQSEGGFTDAAFSGQDIGRLVFGKERITVVQSGDSIFALVVTPEFKRATKAKGYEAKKEKMEEIKAVYDKTFSASKGSFQEKIDTAVRKVASNYHLKYFKGKGSELVRVE